jgi:competence protein ComEC
MIDIGQGDCTLIVEPFHRSAVMIDCGQSLYRDNMTLYVIPFLRSIQVNHLDCLILTHDDFDHSGGYESLSEQIEITQLITDSDSSVPVSYPFVSLCPERNTKDENDNSIVSYFEYDGVQYLWMGDASVNVEKQILKEYSTIRADVLKLGHHGSKTSSSFEFLNQIEPQIGLVSVGKNNHYGHPDSSVITHCTQLGIHVLMTKDVGMVEISSFYDIHWIHSAAGLFGFF